MPLLRLKPFKPETPPKHLKADDEVFLCDLTGEVFTDYEAFYQRMILCNSLVWSCAISGKVNLTYKEALESEKTIRKSLNAIPYSLKLGMLYCVHHTRRSKIQEVTDEIYEYFKTRFQMDEKVEVKINDKWTEAIISEIPFSVDIVLQNKLNNAKPIPPMNSPSKEKLKAFCTILSSLKSKSPMENKELKPDTSDLSYKVLIRTGARKGETLVMKRKLIRRAKKGVFSKDKVKLFLKETCQRSTTSSDDGFWVVQKKEVAKYELGASCAKVNAPLSSLKNKKKPVKAYLETQTLAQHQRQMEQERVQLEQERKRKLLEQEALKEQREKKLIEEKALREQKLKEKEEEKARLKLEKEEEKARKKDEREKERKLDVERKNLELDFTREFGKVKEDLLLEDSKMIPQLALFNKSSLNEDIIGDAITVVEFVNTFGSLLGLEQEVESNIDLPWLEEALTEHDAEGNYFTILKFLLHTYLRLDKEENEAERDDDEDEGSSSEDENTDPVEPPNEDNNDGQQKASANASAAAAWTMLHQGMSLSDISIEPFSLTEVLRLHILSSGVRLGGVQEDKEWQRRGQYQLSDDPCVSFRHQEQEVMKWIMTSSVYDLSPKDKVKILNLLCNQLLMLSTTRDFMEDAYDRVKSLQKELKQTRLEEKKRREKLQSDKWKQKVAERKKVKEEEKLKKQKKLEMQQNSENNPGGSNEDNPQEASNTNEDKENGQQDKELEEEEKEREEERKRKKEEKDQEMDDFHHEKFLFREKEILKEINEQSARISETPLGVDRFFRRYWNFNHVDGILIEKDENAPFNPSESENEDNSDTDNEGDSQVSDHEQKSSDVTSTPTTALNSINNDSPESTKSPSPSVPKVTYDDILNAKKEHLPLTRMLLNRYGCQYNERSEEFVTKSPALLKLIENVKTGVDAQTCVDDISNGGKWSYIPNKNSCDDVITSLNMRGTRESALHAALSDQGVEFPSDEDQESSGNMVKPGKEKDANEIDKSLFETMDDYIEGNLRDHLLEIEERLWVGGIGVIKCEDRLKWRTDIEQGMVKLIKYDKNTNDDRTENMKKSDGSTVDVPVSETSEGTKIDNTPVSLSDTGLPSHLTADVTDEGKRCSTPVNVPEENEKLSVIKELAEALLLIERGIESKYLKPPLGETEEMKKEKQKDGSGSTKEDDDKKSSCMSRWEESLINCISFSQIFIHLDTLDRSIIWAKSIQNTKCRLCRRKGDEDEMLLCDGCDRGFHMSCLKPKLKCVPEGDWFCPDCRPIEIKRRSRKASHHVEEEEDEENESEEESDEDTEDDDSQSDADEDEDEDNEDGEESDGTEHGERCTVCNEEGTLILCEECPRGFHVGCCYPQLRKVPRGSWTCQICSGLDKDLPYRKRAKTIERVREQPVETKPKKKPAARKSIDKTPKLAKEKRRTSSPLINIKPAKKSKLETDSSPAASPASSRPSGAFRHQLKQCTALINDIFNQEEAEDFSIPVDTEEVPDYLTFIDKPMDFGTIKRKLNMAKYVDLQDFLDDIKLVFTNCETYNTPRSRVYREGSKLKAFVLKKCKDLGLGQDFKS